MKQEEKAAVAGMIIPGIIMTCTWILVVAFDEMPGSMILAVTCSTVFLAIVVYRINISIMLINLQSTIDRLSGENKKLFMENDKLATDLSLMKRRNENLENELRRYRYQVSDINYMLTKKERS